MKIYIPNFKRLAIATLQCERETNAYYICEGDRRVLRENAFLTWQEARDKLERCARDALEGEKQLLDVARSDLQRVQAMKEPEA